MPKNQKRTGEPVVAGSVVAAVVAVAAMLGLDVSEELVAAVVAAVILVAGAWQRSRVTPVDPPEPPAKG